MKHLAWGLSYLLNNDKCYDYYLSVSKTTHFFWDFFKSLNKQEL